MAREATGAADAPDSGSPEPSAPATTAETRAAVRASHENVVRGILAMVAASLFFALTSALSKWQVAIYPVGEVMFLRSLSSFAVVALIMLPRTGFGVYRTGRPGAHLARGLSQSISQTFTVLAFWLMPLAGAIAINFSAPLWATLLSLFLLKERPGARRWIALLVGFSGVVVVAAPGADSFQLGALFALANAVMYGSVTVAVRGMTATESSHTLLIWQLSVVAVLHATLLVFGVRMPTAIDATMLILSGVSNACAQYCWTKALTWAPTAAVSPFYYLTLIWAVGLGYLVWGDVPTVSLLVGSAVVVGSGLFLLWSEARKR